MLFYRYKDHIMINDIFETRTVNIGEDLRLQHVVPVWATKYLWKVLIGDIEASRQELLQKIAAENDLLIASMKNMPE